MALAESHTLGRLAMAELAELAKLTPARVTQIMNLLYLAPDIGKEIFFLPPATEGQPEDSNCTRIRLARD
jgi:hypothetical protein